MIQRGELGGMPGGAPTKQVEAAASLLEVEAVAPGTLQVGKRRAIAPGTALPQPPSIGQSAGPRGGTAPIPRPVPARGVHAVDWSVLREIREKLKKAASSRTSEAADLDFDDSCSVSRGELASAWLEVVDADQRMRGMNGLMARDKEFIDIRVGQSIRELEPRGAEMVDLDEWVHHMLLTRSSPRMMRAMLQINAVMDEALKQCPGILVGLQHAYEVSEQSCLEQHCERGALMPVRDVLGVFSRKLWHLRPAAESQKVDVAARAASAAAGEIVAKDPDEFVRTTACSMDMDLEGRISNDEFLALCLGRREQEVSLHFYDLSKGLAAAAAPWLINQKVEGVWHTGIVAFGREYYFGGDIYYDLPSQTGFGPPQRKIVLGRTLRQRDELHAYIVDDLKPIFCRQAYDAARNNCNHFTDRLAMFLVGKHIPEEVLKQPELVMNTNVGRVLRPFLNRWLGLYFEPPDTAEKVPPGRAHTTGLANGSEPKGEGIML